MHHDNAKIWGEPRPDGIEENFCWKWNSREKQIMTRSADWTRDTLVWSPCVRCDLLEYYYKNLHSNDMFCLATPFLIPVEGKNSQHQFRSENPNKLHLFRLCSSKLYLYHG